MTDFTDLIDGYRRFRAGGWQEERARWTALAKGQSPKVMVIACSDSRVDPATLFDTSPGEIFVVRNVANLVPPYDPGGGIHGVSAALEFAVTQLEVRHVVVMGHGACGGVHAAMTRRFADKGPGEGGFISSWMSLLDDARDRIAARHGDGEEAVAALELEGVRTSLANLRGFPFVAPREADGRLTLHGAWFAIEGGTLHLLDEASGRFAPA